MNQSASNGNGNEKGLNPVVKIVTAIGFPVFLVLWLLGAFNTFLPSPITVQLEAHDRRQTSLLRLICQGIWQDNSSMWDSCQKAERDGTK